MLVLLSDEHFEEVMARRHEWGADKLDEVWTGIPHLRPVGGQSDLQHEIALLLRPVASRRGLVPALGAYEPRAVDQHRDSDATPSRLRGDQAATAALAVEIVTRGDEARPRLASLAADHVAEVVVVDSDWRTVDWLALADDHYEAIAISRLIDLSPARLAETIPWPTPGHE